MSANDAAAKYAKEGGYDCNPRYERDAFLAGVEWALSPPTPEEIDAVRNALNKRGVDANDNEAISAINRFLEERKR